uniref:Uncharacterized protein n=1 Tax=Fagus sylvatica TaxID=28930 RepID=A0A2N9FKM6_FAGSY
MLEGPHAQGLVESEPVVDLVIDVADHDVPAGDTNASAADTLAGSDHLGEHRLDCCLVGNFCFHRLGCRLDGKISVPMDLVVILWKILFHGLGCRPMESFCSMDLVVVLWKILFHGLGCRPMENSVPWTWLSSYGKFCFFCYHRLDCCLMEVSFPMDLVVALWRIPGLMDLVVVLMKGVDDAVHVSEEIDEVGITGEVTVVSPPRRPTIEAGSSVGVGGLSGEVAAFLREFDARAPNPHPEQFFWSFNGPLVPFGDFWVPNDCSPYLSRLSAGHSDFTKGFKLSIGLGGPMMSLLGSVLAAMDESSLEDVTKTQDPCVEECDPRPYGYEIKALQHQIALLQDSLAELTAYQDAMMSTGGVVPRSERGGSFLDSLLN